MHAAITFAADPIMIALLGVLNAYHDSVHYRRKIGDSISVIFAASGTPHVQLFKV